MAEGITLKRIIDMDEAAELTSSDYALVDSATGGPKKFAIGQELGEIKDGLSDMDDRVTALEQGGSGGGLTEDIKQALLQLAEKVAYVDDDGQDYYDALEDALYPPADLVSISAVYTQSGTVYDTDSLDSLKADLVVTATYNDQTTAVVTTYTLSGTLVEGISTITVAYGGKTTTFDVTVTHKSSGKSDETDWSDGVAYDYVFIDITYIDNTDGSVKSYNGWSSTPKLFCQGATSLTFTAITDSSAADANAMKYNAFYDANGGFVGTFQIGDMQTLGTISTITVPNNAVYFAVSSKTAVFRKNSQFDPYVTITPNA